MNAAQLIARFELCEVDRRVASDARRMMRDERMSLLAAVSSGDGKRIAATITEAKRVAAMWGIDLESRPTVRQFVKLDAVDMPSASWIQGEDEDDLGSPWLYLSDFAMGHDIGAAYGSSVILRADRDGWRDGICVVLH